MTSECFQTHAGLVEAWSKRFAELYGEDGQATEKLKLYETHLTEFRGVAGIRGELGIGDDVEIAHVWTPSSSHPDKCGLCHGPRTASRPAPGEIPEDDSE